MAEPPALPPLVVASSSSGVSPGTIPTRNARLSAPDNQGHGAARSARHTPKPPPLGTPCGDCLRSTEYLTAFRAAAMEPNTPLCGRCAYDRVTRDELVHSFDLIESPQELLDRVADRLRAVVQGALLRGQHAAELVGLVNTRNGSQGHYAVPQLGVGPRVALARDLEASADAAEGVSPPHATRRARRAAARERRRVLMRVFGCSRLARPAPTGSVFVIVTSTDDAAVLVLPLVAPARPPGPG